MKIAIMMRPMDQDSGLRVYTERLVESMLEIDKENLFLLFYRSTKWQGRFSEYSNAKEILITCPHKILWDQVAVPYKAWKEGADIIFNPKFSVPLIIPCPVAMSLREPAWWAWREHYPKWNAALMRTSIPLYVKKSVALFPISNFVLEENLKYHHVPKDKIAIAYPGPNKHFRPVTDTKILDEFKARYNLPQKYILSVTRVDHPGIEETKSFFPGKNPETTLRAFLDCRGKIPHKLVFAGRRVQEYLLNNGFREANFDDVVFLDFVPHDEIVLLYSLADLFVLPTFYESYGQTLVEAMSCGLPVIASKTGACPEISGGAAILADPNNPADFANKMLSILKDDTLRQELSLKSLKRAAFFSWKQTAKIILTGLTEASKK